MLDISTVLLREQMLPLLQAPAVCSFKVQNTESQC